MRAGDDAVWGQLELTAENLRRAYAGLLRSNEGASAFILHSIPQVRIVVPKRLVRVAVLWVVVVASSLAVWQLVGSPLR